MRHEKQIQKNSLRNVPDGPKVLYLQGDRAGYLSQMQRKQDIQWEDLPGMQWRRHGKMLCLRRKRDCRLRDLGPQSCNEKGAGDNDEDDREKDPA